MLLNKFRILAIILLSVLLSTYNSPAQDVMEVTSTITPEQMVNLLIGGGVTTMNVTYTGANQARGKFWGGPGNMGVEDGVLLTSGNVTIAPGPNNSGSAGANNSQPGDPDLQSLSGVTSNDACILEFDFIPQSSLVSFRYVFASEEYLEYVGAGVNDAFGFFISGPGISGPYSNSSINIALIPLSTTPVSINTVNHLLNEQYFVTNTQNYTQYDGFTTVLTAFATVTPCEVYHIKLSIGDGGDYIYDSGVFLEANSFESVGIDNEVSFTQEPYVDFAIEDCSIATVLFRLSDMSDFDMWMPIIIEGTAINGVDYLEIPDSVFFPIGYTTSEIEIIPFEDNSSEWVETVEIIYNSSLCEVNMDTVLVQIKDYAEMTVETSPDTMINCNTSATVRVDGVGGFAPYTYIWSTGDTTTSITVNPLITTTYYVTVVALCDSMGTDSVTVIVDGPESDAGDDMSVAYGTPATLQGSASQGSGSYTYSWEPAALLDDPTSPTPTTMLMEITTVFTLTVTDLAGGCMDADDMIMYVTGGPLGTYPYATPDVICYGGSTQLFALASGGSEDYTYTWTSDPPGFNSDIANPYVEPLLNTTYLLTLFDGYNTVTGHVEIEVLPLPLPDAGADKSIPYGIYTTLDGGGSSGSGDYLFTWEPADKLINPTAPNPTTVKLYETTIFTLSIEDNITGCVGTDEDVVTITVDGGPLNVAVLASDSIICDGGGAQLFASGGGGDTTGIYTYSWSSTPQTSGWPTSEQNPMVNPVSSTLYTVILDDGFNTIQNSLNIAVSYAPVTDLGGDVSACPYDSVVLTANIPGMDYYWSNGSIEESIKIGTTGIGFDIKEVWLEITNEEGCVGTDVISVIFDFAQCFGIEELTLNDNISIFPNPSTGLFNIIVEEAEGELLITLYNIHGQEVYQRRGYVSHGDIYQEQVDLVAYPKGLYLLEVINDSQVYRGKIIKK